LLMLDSPSGMQFWPRLISLSSKAVVDAAHESPRMATSYHLAIGCF
jgi:hypothetical protein